MEKVRIAVIGCGNMGKFHGMSYAKMNDIEMVACCDIIEDLAKSFAETYNIKYYTNYLDLFNNEKIDAVAVVTNDDAHKMISMEALKRNIHTLCEKPLSDTLENAKEMKDYAQEKLKEGIFTCVNFSYRNYPASQKLSQIIKSGKYGKVISFEAHYKQSWISSKVWGDYRKDLRKQWRMSTRHGSLGTMGDVGVHIYDLTRFICGDFDEIFCQLDHYNKDVNQVGEYVFDANETMFTIAKLKDGARGTIDASRWATGFANEVSMYVYCEKGSFNLNLDRMRGDQLHACVGENVDKAKWEVIPCEDTPTNFQRFVDSIKEGKQGQTSFAGAYEIQKILDASMKSNEKQGYIKL